MSGIGTVLRRRSSFQAPSTTYASTTARLGDRGRGALPKRLGEDKCFAKPRHALAGFGRLVDDGRRRHGVELAHRRHRNGQKRQREHGHAQRYDAERLADGWEDRSGAQFRREQHYVDMTVFKRVADNLSNFTVSAWFKTSTSVSGQAEIVSKLSTGGLTSGQGSGFG